MSKNPRLNTALRAIRREWAVLALHSVQDGQCGCGDPNCASAGKHPMTTHGVHDATTNARQVRRWWRRSPEANIGIATGLASGVVVLDVDKRSGGFESLKTFEKKHGQLPPCPTVLTGGGGKHFFFASPENGLKTTRGALPGIDLLGCGAFVVGVGSTHKSGAKYLWMRDRTPSKLSLPSLPLSLLKLTRALKEPEQRSDELILEGTRNKTLLSLAGKLRSQGLSMQAVEAALIEDNYRRCVPPLNEREIRAIVASIGRYPARAHVQSERNTLPFRTAADFCVTIPTKVPWVCEPWVARNCITEVTGKIKNGKTTFVMGLLASVLCGRTFLGHATLKTGAVYLSEERDVTLNEALRRADLKQNRDLTLLLATETRGWSWESVVEASVAECKLRNAGLLIIDTFAQFSRLEHGQENNSGDVLAAIKPLQEAAAAGLAVALIHHERKGGGEVSDSGRGSSALSGAVDVVISLRRPDGRQPRNIRTLHTLSRFSETPPELLIELTENGYRALGAPGDVAVEQAATLLKSSLPTTAKQALVIDELSKRTGKGRAYIQRLLDALLEKQQIERTGKGAKGSPYRYYACENTCGE